MGERLDAVAADALAALADDRTPDGVVPVVVRGGAVHLGRVLVFLLGAGSGEPLAVAKVAFGPAERRFIETEHENLLTLRRVLDPPMLETVPVPLAFGGDDEAVWLIVTPVPGRRIVMPYLAGSGGPLRGSRISTFLERAIRWSRSLADQSAGERRAGSDVAARVERFVETFDPPCTARRSLIAFATEVERSAAEWRVGWQHGQLSPINVLYRKRRLAVLDWEHALREAPPWYDAVNSILLMALLAHRQTGGRSLVTTASSVLQESHWVGRRVAAALAAAWDHPVPVGWGIAIGFVEAALVRYDRWRTTIQAGHPDPGRVGGWTEWARMVGLLFDREPALAWMRP